MHRILFMEKSATLRRVLTKLLRKNNYQVDSISDYTAGPQALLAGGDAVSSYQGLVLGWPGHTDHSADELLVRLDEPDLAHCAVMIVAQEAEPAIRNWVAERPRSAMVLWEDYAEVPDSLGRLLAPLPPPALEPLPAGVDADPIRILFVDDSPTVRVSYRRLLAEQGYLVETAAGVEEGYDLARQRLFDIAIVDYFMPDGNGDRLCRRLREDPVTRNITTAILTGTYLDEVIRDALDAGAVECMFKNEAHQLFLARVEAISRSIRVQKSIEAERQRLESILNSVGDGVYGVDRDGMITFTNPAAKRILGYKEDDCLIGQSPHALFHYAREDGNPNPAEVCVLQQVYGTAEPLFGQETVFWTRDRRTIPVECTVYPLRVQHRLEGSVVAFRDISERKTLEEKLRWQATHDPLTEMFNRRYFEDQLESEVKRLHRSDEVSALLYLDLDRFKYINDTAGHAAGDQLLIEVARLLRSRLRASDLLARLGGDEFAIIMRNIDVNAIHGAADSFRRILSEHPFNHRNKTYKVHCSAGVAAIDKHTESPGEVLADADIACYIAKTEGRNQTHLYSPDNDRKRAMDYDLGWSARLSDALQHDHLTLCYQPILSMADLNDVDLPDDNGLLWSQLVETGRTATCYEILVRLLGSNGELITPGAFLPTAERFNLMRQIDHWVVARALRTLGELNAEGTQTTFSINLSGQTLGDKSLLPLIKDLLKTHSVAPQSLIFEITETAAISNIDTALKLINELTALGCRFALDDFGSGFSSFYHLKHLPVEFIKLDGSFVQGMTKDTIDRAMVASMNDIAHSVGRRTIAEYVESADILRLLKKCGVDYVQGFYLSEPLAEIPQPARQSVAAS